jgi:putative transcriptional regulator
MNKRELFEELMKGIEEMTAHREERFEEGSNQVGDPPIAEERERELVAPQANLHRLSTDNS